MSKYLALPTWPSISSTVCIRCLSRQTLPFNLVRSAKIHTLSLDFGTTTILAHHSVASLTSEMSLSQTIFSSSSFTFGNKVMAPCHGVERAYGLASGKFTCVFSFQHSKALK